MNWRKFQELTLFDTNKRNDLQKLKNLNWTFFRFLLFKVDFSPLKFGNTSELKLWSLITSKGSKTAVTSFSKTFTKTLKLSPSQNKTFQWFKIVTRKVLSPTCNWVGFHSPALHALTFEAKKLSNSQLSSSIWSSPAKTQKLFTSEIFHNNFPSQVFHKWQKFQCCEHYSSALQCVTLKTNFVLSFAPHVKGFTEINFN